MAKLTMTEALAELKTIDKKIQKKCEFIHTYLLRFEQMKDPLLQEGGSVTAIEREFQGIKDLEDRKVLIRRRIAETNLETMVTVNNVSRSIADWLVWRRDVSKAHADFLKMLHMKVEQARQEAAKRGSSLVSVDIANAKTNDIVVNLNEKKLAAQREELEEILGNLDGQLSLKNAVTTIDV